MNNIQTNLISKGGSNLDEVVKSLQKPEWETLEYSCEMQYLLEFLQNPNNYLLLAYIDGEVAGMLVAYNLQKLDGRDKEMLLYEIETKARFRKLGVGKALILKLKEIAELNGSHEIWVLTDEDNIIANKLYQGLGIKTVRSEQVMYNYPIKK